MASTKPTLSLICVGSELLRGKINTHASTLARRLSSIGLELTAEQTIGDTLEALTAAIAAALAQFDVTIVTGGLGPTFDDLSREAAAAASGRPLYYSEQLFKGIAAKFRRAAYQMPATNARQAYLLEGAEAIPNPVGTAPGQWLNLPVASNESRVTSGNVASPLITRHSSLLILLPGPPSELQPMLEATVLPKLKRQFPQRPCAEAHLHFAGAAESLVDQRVRPLINRASRRYSGDVQFTILAKPGLVDLDIFVSADTKAAASSRVSSLARKVKRVVGRPFYGDDDSFPLARVVQTHFLRRGMTLSVAESCTGGLLGGTLTDIAGSSEYFLGGAITYSNALKQDFLGVSPAVLKRWGAVSLPVARAMAEGIRRRTGSTWGFAITGVAGPTGGSAKKPVGLIFMAAAGPRGTRGFEFHFRGYREAIRQRAVVSALDILRRV